MLESDAIIKYLFEEYGDGVVSFKLTPDSNAVWLPQQQYDQQFIRVSRVIVIV